MFIHPSRLLFFILLILGTLSAVSASSWFSIWVGLEINLLAFLPLIFVYSSTTSEAMLKYFLTQALASVCLFMILVLTASLKPIIFEITSSNFLFMVLMLKLGAAPFHMWFPEVSDGLAWIPNLILMTWQKIAPLVVSMQLSTPGNFLLVVIMSSLFFGGVGGFNQVSLRKILAYSSVSHLGWLLAASTLGLQLTLIYFSFYIMLSTILIFWFSFFNFWFLHQIFSYHYSFKIYKHMLMMNLLSLGGLPPFLGFLPKWVVLVHLNFNQFYLLSLLMVILSLIPLYFYLRVTYSALVLTHMHPSWCVKPLAAPPYLIFLSAISILGLPLAPLILFL
uniref:NADH-ubiquinone oxidoreductase chain 2 n=1 Tax=Teloganodidae sp. MT-2014 TaxID=1560024 RepID=A0A0A0S1K5_9INSE|nr:NADH dehydrogenase subunit 2 [Teloganodidae sp. MT-2014]